MAFSLEKISSRRLGLFFQKHKIRLQENRLVTHFLPKLTKIELRLVAMKDNEYLNAGDLKTYMFFTY